MKLGSLFDGSGGFPLGGAMCGIEPVWASEIEPFPIRVTSARFPGMKHLGDVTKINGAEIEPVDVITFGSPCQDLSVAGKMAGIHNWEKEGGDTPLIAFIPRGFGEYIQSEESSTLRATRGADLCGGSEALVVNDAGKKIRRLTPTECARLQGFPDWWTDGVEGSETAKYKMWGNGVSLNAVYFVMRGIAEELERSE